jgi:hypothetical protein
MSIILGWGKEKLEEEKKQTHKNNRDKPHGSRKKLLTSKALWHLTRSVTKRGKEYLQLSLSLSLSLSLFFSGGDGV